MQRMQAVHAAWVFLLCGVLLFTTVIGCANIARSLPTAEQLAENGAVPVEVDLNALRRGRALAVTECSQCHRFFWPDEYSVQEWKEIIPRMASLSSLHRRDARNLELYILAASARIKNVQDMDEK